MHTHTYARACGAVVDAAPEHRGLKHRIIIQEDHVDQNHGSSCMVRATAEAGIAGQTYMERRMRTAAYFHARA